MPRDRRRVGLLGIMAIVAVAACGTSESDIAVPIARPTGNPAPPSVAAGQEPLLTHAGEVVVVAQPGDDSSESTDPDETLDSADQPVPASTALDGTPAPAASPTTLPPRPPPRRELADETFGATQAAFDRLARSNLGASVTVVRGGDIVFSRASGTTIDGQPASGDSPMVVASVSKLVVAMGVARLHDQGLVDVEAPVPWADLGLTPSAGWNDVTVRELLDHRSGLAKARYSWFTGEGTCRDYVPTLLDTPPNGDRGRWVYSNGNYCILGLLIEQRTGQPLDAALQGLVFDPVGASGVHLTYGGLQPGDVPHPEGVERLSRLGGAGTLIVSTDDTATMLGRMTAADREILRAPGVFTDQYGFGHTGSVDGAYACIWVLELGATVVSATIAGNSVSSGGGVCDLVVTAVATDLGLGTAKPDRTP